RTAASTTTAISGMMSSSPSFERIRASRSRPRSRPRLRGWPVSAVEGRPVNVLPPLWLVGGARLSRWTAAVTRAANCRSARRGFHHTRRLYGRYGPLRIDGLRPSREPIGIDAYAIRGGLSWDDMAAGIVDWRSVM